MTVESREKKPLARRYQIARIALFAVLYAWIGWACLDQVGCRERPRTAPSSVRPSPASAGGAATRPGRAPVPAGAGVAQSPPGKTHTMKSAGAAEPAPGTAGVSWRTLGDFAFSKGMQLPRSVSDLDGKEVSVNGFMLLFAQESRITEFALVESVYTCCYGAPPTVNQVIVVNCADAGGTEFVSDPVQVSGTLDVGEQVDSDGVIISVYRLRAKAVKRLP